MGTSPAPDAVVELSEGLSLVPCTMVSLSFVRADVSVKPVDEWQLKGGLMAMFKKRFGLVVADRDLVVHKEKNYFKKRRDEPIADGTLHLWGGSEATANGGPEGVAFGKYLVENVNGVELSIGGLKLKCLAVIKETNDFEALKRAWEAVSGPRRGGAAQGQGGPTTLTLKGVPSRWFAEPRVSSKPSVLVTHTIFSRFGEIRNLEVMSNEDPAGNPKDIGSMAAALQCQIWVQFDSHTNFCTALHAFCGRAMQKAGSNFRAMYVIDWDKENYFSVLNVRKRKFEKERVERQLQAEAERIRKEEIEAHQAALLRAEVERLKTEQLAAALREEERQLQLAEQAQRLEDESRMMLHSDDTSSAEEGLIQDDSQESSDGAIARSEREGRGRRTEEDGRFSPPQRLNGRLISEGEGERHLQQARGKGGQSSGDEEALHSTRTREKRAIPSEDTEEEDALFPHGRDKRRFTTEDSRDAVPMKGRAKRIEASEDEDPRRLKRRRDVSESESESESENEERHVRKTVRRDNTKDGSASGSPEVRGKRVYTSEDDDERQPPQSKAKRRYRSDAETGRSPASADNIVDNHKDGGRNIHAPEASADEEMYNPLERWQPEEETVFYSKSTMQKMTHTEQPPGAISAGRMASRKRSPSPRTTDSEKEEREDERELGRRKAEDTGKMERWVLDATHSVASLSAADMLFQVGSHAGGFPGMERSEKRLRSVVIFSR